MSPSSGPVTRHPPSLHRVASGRLPRPHRYYRYAPTPCRPSRRTSFPSLGGTTFALGLCSHVKQRLAAGQERLFLRRPTPETLGRDDRISWVPGRPPCPHAPLSDPGRTSTPGHCGVSVLPSANTRRRQLPHLVFRGSITQP